MSVLDGLREKTQRIMPRNMSSTQHEDLNAWAASVQQAHRDQEIAHDCFFCHGKSQAIHDMEYNPRLCLYCQTWNDIRHPLSCMGPVLALGYKGQSPRPLITLFANKDCIMCKLISAAVHERVQGEDVTRLEVLIGSPYQFSHDSRFPPQVKRAPKHPVALKFIILVVCSTDITAALESLRNVNYGPKMHQGQSVIGVQAELTYSEYARHLQTATRWENSHFSATRWENSHFSPHVLGTELDRCETKHPQCGRTVTRGMPAGMRLVDIQAMNVVDASSSARFAALSYAWRAKPYEQFSKLENTTIKQLRKPGSLNYDSIPRVIWDATVLCKDLGIRYLWVDRLCIVQDDRGAMSAQIMAMDAIYQGAVVTIVAAADDSEAHPGLPGVKQHPRTSHLFDQMKNFQIDPIHIRENINLMINSSRWNTRGWTFQERLLSRRMIIISEHQSYFLCGQSAYQEDIGIINRPQAFPRTTFRNEITSITNVNSLSRYFDCVDEYTSRDLSYDSDILKAFSGVTNYLSMQLNTSFLFGMPERYLVRSLLWAQVDKNTLDRRNSGFAIPTWSWAAWKGGVQYITALGNYHNELLEELGHNATDYGTLVRMFVCDMGGALRRLDIEERWFQEEKPFAHIENNPLPNEKTAVASYWKKDPTQVWLTSPHNPWTVFQLKPPDEETMRRAAKFEGALLFQTTLASLSIRHRTRYLDRAVIDICERNGKSVGRMQRMTNAWMGARVDLTKTYQFIVLCAGVFPRLEGRGPYSDKDLWDSEGYMDHLWRNDLLLADPINRYFDVTDRDPWMLRVMMVEQDDIDSRVFRRIAIGFVETRCWAYCQPQWTTVVLV